MTLSKNIFLTFDVEEFYHAELISREVGQNRPVSTSLERNVTDLIDLCGKYDVKATWFVLGEVAETKPQIVKAIHNSGHEVASHSYSHRLIYDMTPTEFEYDLKKSLSVLEDITGEKVIGYRAPSWSVNKETLNWFYDILIVNGIKYSSSIYPGKTFLYGIPDAKNTIHRPVIDGIEKEILEIPQYLRHFLNFKFGFSGGFYMRFFPYWMIKYFIKESLSETTCFFLYLHPYEIDYSIPRYKLGLFNSFIQYYNIKDNLGKLKRILKYNFANINSIKDFINLTDKV